MKKFFALILLLLFPFSTLAKVRINEVAWMGTEKSSYGEWVELYNDSDSEIDLSDGGLYEEGGNVLIIKLTKKIGPKSYYLIERVTPSNPDPILEIADDMGSFGGSGLKNLPGGEYLVLKLKDGTILDTIDASLGWPAGDSDTKSGVRTMQFTGASWITATATPKAINLNTNSEISGSNSSTTTINNNQEDYSQPLQNEENISYSAHSSSAELSKIAEKRKVGLISGRNRISLVGAPVQFSGKFIDDSGKNVYDGTFNWSFGDGTYSSGSEISHIYDISGDYVVILSAMYDGNEYIGRTIIKVIEPSFEINNKFSCVSIKNNLKNEVNLKGWKIQNGNKIFTLQTDTIILPEGDLCISSKILSLDIKEGDVIELISPSGKFNAASKLKVFKNLSFVDKPVDNYVDKIVDKVGENKLNIELSRLESKLKELQSLLTANISNSIKNESKGETEKENKILKEAKTTTHVSNTEIGTSSIKVIKLESKSRDSFVWNFLKSFIYR